MPPKSFKSIYCFLSFFTLSPAPSFGDPISSFPFSFLLLLFVPILSPNASLGTEEGQTKWHPTGYVDIP